MPEPYFDSTLRDGRRQSNPLTDPSSHVVKSPNVQLWKHAIADDAALSAGALVVPREAGANFAGYLSGVLQLVPRNGAGVAATPGGTSNPVVTLLEWNPGRGAYVSTGETGLTAGGAGVPRSYQFSARGRFLYFHVTGITGGQSVSIYTQGSDDEDRG